MSGSRDILLLLQAAWHLLFAFGQVRLGGTASLSHFLNPETGKPGANGTTPSETELKAVRKAMRRLASRLPASCLVESVGMARWLNAISCPYHFHVAVNKHSGTDITGHAWVTVKNLEMTPGLRSSDQIELTEAGTVIREGMNWQ